MNINAPNKSTMSDKTVLVSGSSGLIGSEVCVYFARQGFEVHGLDNNQRAVFFGPQGDTRWNQHRLERELPGFVHHEEDVRSRQAIQRLVAELRPSLIVHAAAQPSHDRAAAIPFDDFDTNAVGTLNLLEAARQAVPESPFVLMSTNKVYGDGPNRIPLAELETRWDYADPNFEHGIPETFSIDQSLHSLFGASKVAADVLVQEYGRYFGMPTCCLRGGCLTGPNHSGVELHGFLSYLVKCNLEGIDVPRLRLPGQAGPRQHPQLRRRSLHPCIRRESALRRGLQPRRRQGKFVLDPRSVLARRALFGQAAAIHLRRDEPRRRPHLLLQRPSQDAATLSALGHHRPARRHDRPDRRGLAAADCFVKILITGGCGFVGSTLARAWRERHSGDEVWAVDNFIRPGSEQNRRTLDRLGVRVRHADLRCWSDVDAWPAVDAVIDAAANPSVLAGVDGLTSSRQLVEHNLSGTVNLLEYCRRHKAALVLLEHQPGVLDSGAGRTASQGRGTPVRAGSLTRSSRRADAGRGIGRLLNRGAGIPLRRDEARERTAGAGIRLRLWVPGVDQPVRSHGGRRPVRPRRSGHLQFLD